MKVSGDVSVNKRRGYEAPARRAQAQATRERVLAAAHELFANRGFTATMSEVADRARVSQGTVELLFGTKAKLLGAVVDVALAGDHEPVPILDRAWVAELRTQPAPQFLERAGAAFAAGAARVAPIFATIEQGAQRDQRLAELAGRLERQRTVMATWVVESVEAQHALAADLSIDDAVDTVLVVLDPAVHRRLLLDRRWSSDQLATWLGRSFIRLLLDPISDRPDGAAVDAVVGVPG